MDQELINAATANHYCMNSKYKTRLKPKYYSLLDDGAYQPNVYRLAKFIAERIKCQNIIDIGSASASKLTAFHPRFHIIGVDFGANVQYCREKFSFGTWIDHNLDTPAMLTIPDEIVKDSIIICADVIEHLINPGYLLCNLRKLLDSAPICLLSTPDRVRVRGNNHKGPPPNSAHVREWNSDEFIKLLHLFQLNVKFSGFTVSNSERPKVKNTILAILGNNQNHCKDFDRLIGQSEIVERT
ncbi:methyltransferase domain-containing protein [Brevibacillus sp. H7]|uniref:methyltransferase domain-containing protein n=1 Tax=Brevibacillus sp. H7 TaxID=3349138 RepID=UPI00382C3E2C